MCKGERRAAWNVLGSWLPLNDYLLRKEIAEGWSRRTILHHQVSIDMKDSLLNHGLHRPTKYDLPRWGFTTVTAPENAFSPIEVEQIQLAPNILNRLRIRSVIQQLSGKPKIEWVA